MLFAPRRSCYRPAMTTSPPDAAELDALETFAGRLADAARRESLPRFRTISAVDDKAGPGDFDPVTEADRAAESAIRALIEAKYPSHGILGEEHGVKPADGPWEWTLDPIDGTRAFISGIPMWTTLIALSFEGRPIIGVIDQPYLNERFVGRSGAGQLARASFERGATRQPLKVRACPELTRATISTTDPFIFNGSEMGGFEQVRRTARLARYGCDAYAYAMVAAGQMDMVIEASLQPYDVRALVPVIEGAGGLFTNWRGEPAWDGGQVVAAGDPAAHAEALIALKRAAI